MCELLGQGPDSVQRRLRRPRPAGRTAGRRQLSIPSIAVTARAAEVGHAVKGATLRIGAVKWRPDRSDGRPPSSGRDLACVRSQWRTVGRRGGWTRPGTAGVAVRGGSRYGWPRGRVRRAAGRCRLAWFEGAAGKAVLRGRGHAAGAEGLLVALVGREPALDVASRGATVSATRPSSRTIRPLTRTSRSGRRQRAQASGPPTSAGGPATDTTAASAARWASANSSADTRWVTSMPVHSPNPIRSCQDCRRPTDASTGPPVVSSSEYLAGLPMPIRHCSESSNRPNVGRSEPASGTRCRRVPAAQRRWHRRLRRRVPPAVDLNDMKERLKVCQNSNTITT